MTMVPFLDVAAAYRECQTAIDAAIARVVHSGWYIGGPEVAAFEMAFAAHHDVAHAIGVANGLDALVLGLRALGVGPGDEVIVPANTFIATWLAVSAVGATPVPVEPDPRTWLIDPTRIAERVTSRTRGIIPVHLYGVPADLDAIHAVAARDGLFVFDDCAQVHGGRSAGRRIGGLTTLSSWSFYPSKNLGAMGDGGAITTQDAALAERLRVLRNYGSKQKYLHEAKGVNSRLDPLQAAVLGAKLPSLDAWNDRRRALALRYLERLEGASVTLPVWDPGAVWHLFPVLSSQREALKAHLEASGVETVIHYPGACHLQGAYADLGYARGALPITERICETELSLPIGPHLSIAEVDRVCDAVLGFRG
jgi:dTDP-4-amino-4,6-dideoxygalactose transaminase